MDQCANLNIPFLETFPSENLERFKLILDGIFGFSFKGEVREPFKSILDGMRESKIPIGSIDVPSGWDVDLGNINQTLNPEMLVSLTLPKLCTKDFQGTHYLGGRFVPP